MIYSHAYKDKEVIVFGLGLSGISAAKSLMAGGAKVAAYDDRDEGRAAAATHGIPYVDPNTADWHRFCALILSPGVPLTHPTPHWTVEMAHKAGIEVIGDTELFFRAHEASATGAKIIAITGTNGKSTTTALIAHSLSAAGKNVEIGGNIGRPVLDLAPFSADKIYVIEFSSYQIDLTPSLCPDIAILLNITPDHLDRHGSLAGYAAVKARIFDKLDAESLAVIGVDDAPSSKIAEGLRGDFAITYLSADQTLQSGIYFSDGLLERRVDGAGGETLSLKAMQTLRGAHNAQNAAAAFAVSSFMGIPTHDISNALMSFPGLAHRMEVLGRAGQILFVNDSKATNADAAAKALSSFKNIYWIAGGQAKEGGIESLQAFHPNIRKAYLFGECADAFADTLTGKVACEKHATLGQAAAAAAADAAKGEADGAVVLLSPAAASFDQFANFMERGNAFCKAVSALDGMTFLNESRKPN